MSEAKRGLGGSFRRLWFTQTVDELGAAFGSVALAALAILLLHAGPFQVGMLLTVRFVTGPVVGAVAGDIVSRFPLRRVIRISYTIRALALASVPLGAFLHVLTIWQVFPVVAIDAACAAVFAVAYETGLPRMVARDDLGRANSRFAASAAVSSVAGPSAGGLAAQVLTPAIALWSNVVGFALAGMSVFGMTKNVDRAAGQGESSEVVKQSEGWRVVRSHRMLRRVILTRMIANLGGGIVEANLLVFIFGGGLPPQSVGLVVALGATGAFVGVLVSTRFVHLISVGRRLVLIPLIAGSALTLIPASRVVANSACSNAMNRSYGAGSVLYSDAEEQPTAATAPHDPSHIVAAFQQDRWSDGGANAIITQVSDDGGRTWHRSAAQPAFSYCAGATDGGAGAYDRTSDPWMSIGPDGTVYLTALAFNVRTDPSKDTGGANSVIESSSRDGGEHWTAPVTLAHNANPLDFDDKSAVVADPRVQGRAYAVWLHGQYASSDGFQNDPNGLKGPTGFSMTSDGGRTWTPARDIVDVGSRAQTFDNLPVVIPAGPYAGRIVVSGLVFRSASPSATRTTTLWDVTSDDGGKTWSPMHVIAPFNHAAEEPYVAGAFQSMVNIHSGIGYKGIHADIFPSFAADPKTGNLYETWQETGFNANHVSKIALSRSSDGGMTWSPEVRIDASPGDTPAFLSQIAITNDGTIGIEYYDLRNASGFQPGNTDLWLVRCDATRNNCADASASWRETRVTTTGSMDISGSIVVYGQYYLGDYEALTTSDQAFVSVYIVSSPLATGGATDAMASRLD